MAGAAAAARWRTAPARNVSSKDSTRGARRAERVESTWSRVERRKSAHLCSRCSGGNMYGTSQPLSTRGGCKLYGARHLSGLPQVRPTLLQGFRARLQLLRCTTVSACGTRGAAPVRYGATSGFVGAARGAVRPAAGGRQTAGARGTSPGRQAGIAVAAARPVRTPLAVGSEDGATPTAPPTSHDPARPDPSPLRPGASPSDAHNTPVHGNTQTLHSRSRGLFNT